MIIAASGPDGACLVKHLVELGHEVHGTAGVARKSPPNGLRLMGVADRVSVQGMAPRDFRGVAQVLARVQPDEICNLSGQSSVSMSFEQPIETLDRVIVAKGNLLEAFRFRGLSAHLCHTCSGEFFGDTGEVSADEGAPYRPRSPKRRGQGWRHVGS